MTTRAIKWKTSVLLECDSEEGDFQEQVHEGDILTVEKIELAYEDGDEGDIVTLSIPDGITAVANTNWFEEVN